MKKNNIKDFTLITIGVFLVAIAVVYFFTPNNIAAGGISGLAIIINNYIPKVPIGLLILILDSILYIIAFLVIGSKFGGKSIYASLALSSIIWIMEEVFPANLTSDLVLATVFGTLISALGLAIVFNANASTGGTDILAKILNKFFHFDIGKSLLIVDFLVTLLAATTFGLDIGMYALLAVIINGFAIDNVIAGFNTSKEITIMSTCNEEISKFVIEELERGCTFLRGVGGYSKKDTLVLYTVLGRKEFIKLKRYISEVDKNAFITIGEVHEVVGEGFKSIE